MLKRDPSMNQERYEYAGAAGVVRVAVIGLPTAADCGERAIAKYSDVVGVSSPVEPGASYRYEPTSVPAADSISISRSFLNRIYERFPYPVSAIMDEVEFEIEMDEGYIPPDTTLYRLI